MAMPSNAGNTQPIIDKTANGKRTNGSQCPARTHAQRMRISAAPVHTMTHGHTLGTKSHPLSIMPR